jgi:hypothetical protein
MEIIVGVIAFWVVVVFGSQALFKSWRRWYLLQPARSLKEIRNVDYYRHLSFAQFEALILEALRERQYTILGDPHLGRGDDQGYAWRKGKKTVLTYRLQRPVLATDIVGIERRFRAAGADEVLVFTPFPEAPASRHQGVEILGGKKMLRWFGLLQYTAPPISKQFADEKCDCGAAMNERVSRQGMPLLVCSMAPDCKVVRRPERERAPSSTVGIAPRAVSA